MGSDDLYLTHRSLIDRAIAAVCRRQNLAAADAEDFAGEVRLHLIDDDYAVLRKFEGRSSITTYLVTVITHRYQDWRNARWGKWRSSAEAKRLGPDAVLLERLVLRDGLTVDEAHETMRTNFQMAVSREWMESILLRLPVRQGRATVPDAEPVLAALPAGPETAPDTLSQRREAQEGAERARTKLRSALRDLTAEDRLILRMRFEDSCKIADIGHALHLEKAPYKRIEGLLATLRAQLERDGLTGVEAADVLVHGGFDRGMPDDRATGLDARGEVRLFPPRADSPSETARTP